MAEQRQLDVLSHLRNAKRLSILASKIGKIGIRPLFSQPDAKPTSAAAEPALFIGGVKLRNRIALAPMSGVTDLPFRQLAHEQGAGFVVSEMIASEELARTRPKELRKAKGGHRPFVIQLAGREASWMAEGARVAEALGADVIDINMGCPSKEVTGKLSGSALMRDLDHAVSLIDAVVAAVRIPVTLKMRLGWDDRSANAPDLARRAEAAGVRLITVHARTRCQFFKGRADWSRVAPVKRAVSLPVLVNGDISSGTEAAAALAASGADGVMVGRGACGAPWLPARIARFLADGRDPGPPPLAGQSRTARRHVEAMLSHYGAALGLRNARKHIAWYLEASGRSPDAVKSWRRTLCTDDDAVRVLAGLERFYAEAEALAA